MVCRIRSERLNLDSSVARIVLLTTIGIFVTFATLQAQGLQGSIYYGKPFLRDSDHPTTGKHTFGIEVRKQVTKKLWLGVFADYSEYTELPIIPTIDDRGDNTFTHLGLVTNIEFTLINDLKSEIGIIQGYSHSTYVPLGTVFFSSWRRNTYFIGIDPKVSFQLSNRLSTAAGFNFYWYPFNHITDANPTSFDRGFYNAWLGSGILQLRYTFGRLDRLSEHE